MTIDFSQPVPITSIGLSEHKVHYYHPTLDPAKKVWDLTPLIESLRWSDDINQAASEINLKIVLHDNDRNVDNLKNIIKPGGILTVFGQNVQPDGSGGTGLEEIIRGVVFDKSINSSNNNAVMNVTAFEHLIYMSKSQDSEIFHKMTATQIVRYVAEKINFPLGTVAETTFEIPSLIFRKNTWYDMIITALTEDRMATGDRFILRMDKGVLNVIRKVLPSKVWTFEYGRNIFQSELNESIRDLKNKVILYSTETSDQISEIVGIEITGDKNDSLTIIAGGDDDLLEDTQKITDYGLLQHIETGTIPLRYPDAQEYGRHILETLSKVKMGGHIDVPNINGIKWGDAIFIYEPMSGLAAQYYVESAVHIVDPGNAHMELTIQFEDLLPERLFEEHEGKTPDAAWEDILKAEGITNSRPKNKRDRDKNTGEVARYSVPLDEPYQITQEYGANKQSKFNYPYGHSGMDIANGSGDAALDHPVYAAGGGTVSYAGYDKVGGNMVKINHNDGYESGYAHLNVMYVKAGEKVIKGQTIGLVGQTGSAMPGPNNPAGGPHLHFEVKRVNSGVTIDPRELMDI